MRKVALAGFGPATFDSGAYAVRVYFYSPETGLYQGADFVDDREIDIIEGVTTIAPPSYAFGELPVFDQSRQCWHLIKRSGRSLEPTAGQS